MPDSIEQNPVLDSVTPDTPIGVGETQDTNEPVNPPDSGDDTPDDNTRASATDDDTDWKKRHGDAVRWAQREAESRAQLEKRLKEMEAKLNSLKSAGLDVEDISSYLEDTPASQGALPDNYVPKTDFEQAVQTVEQRLWNTAKMVFTVSHPEFKDPDLSNMLDYECARLVQDEIKTAGVMEMTPDQILEKGAKRLTKFINKFKAEGAKSATEKRQKISESGVPEGREKRAPIEEETFSPDDAWISSQRTEAGRIRARS